MCINPSMIWVKRGPNWEQSPVACRQCWRCRQNRVNDYVARALCEAAVSVAVCTVTLTYAPRDDLADKVLHPRHFQLFMKLLRKAGHKVRYLVAGEYGSLKARAHFHAILFFMDFAAGNGEVPAYGSPAPFCRQIPHKQMVHVCEWPHGHITADWSASEKAVRYVCKYLLADDKNNAWFSLSKKPPLGAAWFARKAEKARELGVLPSSFEYLPPGGNRKRPYLMTGATRRDYLAALGDVHGRRRQMSEWVQRSYDKHEREARIRALEAAEVARLQLEGLPLPEQEQPEVPPVGRNAAWYADRAIEEFAAQVDPGHKWEYPFSEWTPPVGAGNGKAQGFFGESRIFNPKPRSAPRAVSGHFSGCPGQPSSGGGSARRDRRARQDEPTPGQQPEVFQGKLV